MNKVILHGALGADPELSYTPSGTAKVTLRVATEYTYKNSDGEYVQGTEWHRVIAWGRRAEVIGEYFSKGSGIVLEGRLQTRSWDDTDGKKQWSTEIVLENFEFPKGKRGASSNDSGGTSGGNVSVPQDGNSEFGF